MDLTRIALLAAGVLSLLMAVFHLRFYALFGWHTEFQALSARSRRIVFTIHLALLLVFVWSGVLTLVFHETLAQATGLALGIDAALALFWTWRTVWQIVYFKPPPGRRGAKARRIHLTLVVVFALLAIGYAVPLL